MKSITNTCLHYGLMMKILDLHFQGQTETVAAFLIETQMGPILVETGPHSTLPQLEWALAAEGYVLEDIRHVFLTHIHLDHGGAAWVFAQHGATIYLHPKGEPHFANPEKLLASARMIYKEDMERLWGDLQPIPAERMRTVTHGEKIHFGKVWLKAWHTPGHAVHHIAWQFGDSLFAGDVAGVRIGHSMVVPPCPPPDINLEEWEASIKMILNQRFSSLFLTHYGEVKDVRPHLTELKGRLRNWANWMKPYQEQGADPAEVTPLFQAYVAKQLEAGGIMGEQLIQYELANPAWMSVAGLMRYWKKRGNSQ